MQAHPGAMRLGQLAQRLHQLEHAGLDRLAVPEAGAVFHVHAVGGGVLADHQQFLDAAFKQRLGLFQHITHRTADEVATHRRDDAEGATVVAALADLEIRIVAWRQLDAGFTEGTRHQVDEGIVRLRQVRMHRVHHFLRGVRAGDGQHTRVDFLDEVAAVLGRLRPQAAGDDNLAVLGQRLADGVQAFLHRVVDEAAGVDDHQVRALEGLGGLVALGAQLGQDQFGIGQRFGAAQADEADFRCRGRIGRGGGQDFTHPAIVPVFGRRFSASARRPPASARSASASAPASARTWLWTAPGCCSPAPASWAPAWP